MPPACGKLSNHGQRAPAGPIESSRRPGRWYSPRRAWVEPTSGSSENGLSAIAQSRNLIAEQPEMLAHTVDSRDEREDEHQGARENYGACRILRFGPTHNLLQDVMHGVWLLHSSSPLSMGQPSCQLDAPCHRPVFVPLYVSDQTPLRSRTGAGRSSPRTT